MNNTALTYYYEDIIYDYVTWKNYNSFLGFVNYDDNVESTVDLSLYLYLLNHFTHYNIRYDTPEPFLFEFMFIYGNKFKKFVQEYQLINKLYQLSDEEITLIQTSLNNLANNPNEEITSPTQLLNYISAQNYSQVNNNKITAYINAIKNIPTLNYYKFINEPVENGMSFNDLFMQILPNEQYLY